MTHYKVDHKEWDDRGSKLMDELAPGDQIIIAVDEKPMLIISKPQLLSILDEELEEELESIVVDNDSDPLSDWLS